MIDIRRVINCWWFTSSIKICSWLVAVSKMIKKVLTALYTDYNILFFDNYSGKATFCCNQMGILGVDTNYCKDDPKAIIRLLAWHLKFEKRKEIKKI